jgi:hypothetical protein
MKPATVPTQAAPHRTTRREDHRTALAVAAGDRSPSPPNNQTRWLPAGNSRKLIDDALWRSHRSLSEKLMEWRPARIYHAVLHYTATDVNLRLYFDQPLRASGSAWCA